VELLAEAGLLGQVQMGVPLPVDAPEHPTTIAPQSDGLAEEDSFPLDALLRPLERPNRGALIEITGAPSSGRTALAYRIAAGAVARGQLVGWVDYTNALDPRFLRRSGLDLRSLLWVRPERIEAALRSAELLLKTGFAVVVLDLADIRNNETSRLTPSVWSRLLKAVHRERASVVVLGAERMTGSFATLGLYSERKRALFDRGLFEGLESQAQVLRNRNGPLDMEFPFRVLHRPAPTPSPS
jgi:hypothetical protein